VGGIGNIGGHADGLSELCHKYVTHCQYRLNNSGMMISSGVIIMFLPPIKSSCSSKQLVSGKGED
jgi:hypothetical protein